MVRNFRILKVLPFWPRRSWLKKDRAPAVNLDDQGRQDQDRDG